METITIHLKSGIIKVLFLSFLYLCSGYDTVQVDIPWERKQSYQYEAGPFVVCPCKPCMTGPKCEDKVSELNPRFSQRHFFIELSQEYKPGTPLPYNTTTYPGGKECPCDDFEYTLKDVRNAMEDDEVATVDVAVFSVNKKTGEISINRPLKAFEYYKMTIVVRNTVSNATDEAKISVALEPAAPRINRYSPEVFNGYEPDTVQEYSHHISKRSVIDPSEVNFTLSVEGDTSAMKVGGKIKFTLDIIFPAASVDMLVELFTPDNESTVMILCDVMVLSIGSNLSPSVGTPTVIMDSKDNDVKYDRAIIDFGVVSNSEVDTVDITSSTISIQYYAVMVINAATTNGGVYWVSAGAEYENEYKIWVGQVSVTVDTVDTTVSDSATFNVGMPTSMALGSSVLVPVDMFLPYPSSTYTFNVFSPLNTSGVMSICSVMYSDVAQNFECGNDMSAVTETLTEDTTSVGNNQGTIFLGMLLNKGSRDVSPVTNDNRVTVYFVLHLYPNAGLIGSTFTVGITLEVDTSTIWVGNSDVTVDAEVTTGLTTPTFVNLTTNLGGLSATIGEPFKVLVDISIPAPATVGVATPYVLEVLSPFSTTGIFKLCSFEIVSVGRDLPCLNKDKVVTRYGTQATDGSNLPDRATMDLGHVININHFGGSGDDIIQVQAIFSPNAGHPEATSGSVHTITIGATAGTESVVLATEDITLGDTASVTPISNATAPSFAMSYYDSATNVAADEVSVLESTKVVIDMTTNRNTKYTKMDMEFLMPVDNDYTYMHVCKAEIETAGKNLPCLTPEWTNSLIEYESKFSNAYNDRARMDVGSICNKEMVNDVTEDNARFAVYLKVFELAGRTSGLEMGREEKFQISARSFSTCSVHMTPDKYVSGTLSYKALTARAVMVLNVPILNDLDEKWISTGLMYSDNQLWVGQIKLKVRKGETFSPSVTPSVGLTNNSTLADIPLGYYAIYSLMMKISPGKRADLEITATVDKPGLDICSIRVAAAGTHLPCVIDDLANKTYAPQTASLDLDIVTNFGDGLLNTNSYFDSNSIIVEILLNADPAVTPDTYQLDVVSYFDTAKSLTDTRTVTGITTTSDLSAIDTTVDTAVTGTLSVGEIAGNDMDLEMAVGETKRILLSVWIPDESIYELKAAVTIPSADVGKLELCDAAIYSAGKNLPCVDTTLAPTMTSAGGTYNDNAEFDLGYVCNRPVVPGNVTENTLTIEAWVRLLPNAAGSSAVGSTVTVAGTVTTFGSSVTVDTLSLTVTDPSTFVDKVKSLSGVSNTTLISVNQISSFPMSIGETQAIQVTATVPPYSVSRFLFDVDLPHDSESACMTVRSIAVTSVVGSNIPCFAPDESKGLLFSPTYTSGLGTTQMTYGYLDLGIITNTGKTHRLGTNVAGDDDVVLEVTIQMADCAGSNNGTKLTLSFGNKIANYIFIYDHDVMVVRDTNEKPDLQLSLTGHIVSSNLIYIDGILNHSSLSTAEGKNTTISVQLPDYLIAPLSLETASLSSYSIASDSLTPNLLEIFFDNFFFTDYFTFRAAITVDTSEFVPNGFSSADTTVYSEVGTDYVSRAATYDLEDWFPYPVNDGNTLTFDLETSSGDGCTVTALGLENGAIKDCQISGSPDYIAAYSPTKGRINSGSAWKPGIRDGTLARKKYFNVYFGNVVQIYEILVSQTTTSDLATELFIEYSNDGDAWFGGEQIDLGVSPSTSETRTLATVVNARYARLQVLNDTNSLARAETAMNFEFYGCTLTSDVPDPCASISPTVSRPVDFYTRSFAENVNNQYVFVCDTDASSSTQKGRCHSSSDGDTWTAMDERLGSLIGFEATEGRIYGYDNNMATILVSIDDGVTWSAADDGELASDKLKAWSAAKQVPLDVTIDLDQGTPTNLYTIGAWGATYDGLFKNNVLKQRWSSL